MPSPHGGKRRFEGGITGTVGRKVVKRWSAAEVAELTRLVERHPREWGLILKKGQGTFAPERTDVNLKDKWRNIINQRGTA